MIKKGDVLYLDPIGIVLVLSENHDHLWSCLVFETGRKRSLYLINGDLVIARLDP